MKTTVETRGYFRFAIGIPAVLVMVGLVSGMGAFVGSQLAMRQAPNQLPLMLNAATAARGKSLSMATGLIDQNVEGLFLLDHATGELQCWIVNPRTTAVAGIFKANVAQDMDMDKSGDADYVMSTGYYNFTGNLQGNVAPSNAICYVADSKSGKVVGYGLRYDKQVMRRGGQMANGLLNKVCAGTIGGAQATRDQ